MYTGDSFFDLSKEQAKELGITLSNDEKGCKIASVTGDLFEVVNTTQPDERRDASLYKTFLVQSYHAGERESRQIQAAPSQETLGYIFPIAAFRDSENFEGKWVKRFADVGFRAVTSYEYFANFGANISVDTLRGRQVYLDDVLDESLSIVVFGRQSLEKMEVDDATLRLMLLRRGLNVVDSIYDYTSKLSKSEWNYKVKLDSPGKILSSEAWVFLDLFKSVDQGHSLIGSFMSLYQALEFCIDHIFTWEVARIADSNLNTWDMKSELSKVTGESHRLGILDIECINGLKSRSILRDLAEVCREFLHSLEIDVDEDAPWYKLLYKCRNVLVHNQLMMLKKRDVPLSDLVTSFREASIEILFAFSKPL